MKSCRPSVDPVGARRATFCFQSAARIFLLGSCHDVTECELILARADIRGFSAALVIGMTICSRHRHLSGRFWRARKSCQYPGHTDEIATVVGRHAVNFQMAEENIFFIRWNYDRRITQLPLSLFFPAKCSLCSTYNVLSFNEGMKGGFAWYVIKRF